MRLEELLDKIATPHNVVKDYPTYDEFVDWCEVDIGLSLERRYAVFVEAEERFRKAGFEKHADIIRVVHERLKKSNK